jgi:hypothetical protein
LALETGILRLERSSKGDAAVQKREDARLEAGATRKKEWRLREVEMTGLCS